MRILILPLLIILSACSSQTFKDTMETVNRTLNEAGGGALSTSEVVSGLKEALVVGTGEAVDVGSKANGFYQNPKLYIPFPPEAQKVKSTALNLGLVSQVTQFEETLNRAAEEAVKSAKPIFVNAITSMTIEDAFGLLQGGDNAATEYLRRKTTASLISTFEPKVQAAVNKVELTKYWNPLASAYNTTTTLTGGSQINPDLTQYVTERAIDGLFVLIAEEEKSIRENPAARITAILERVFGSPEARK